MRLSTLFLLYVGAISVNAQFPAQSFKTISATPPKLQITKSGGALAPGLLVVQPQKSNIAGGYLMTDDGELVYAGHGGQGMKVQRLHGKNVISYWSGISSGKGFGYGHTTILDTSYSVIHVVCPRLGLYIPKFKHTAAHPPKCQGDLHESLITNRGTLLITAYNVTTTDLTSVGGPKKGYVVEGQFYEIDLRTNKTLFKWKSLDHVPVNKAQVPLNLAGKQDTRPFDYFHINSLQPLDDGRFLISSRQTSALYLLNRDGSVEWEFNGYNGGDFGPLPRQSNGKRSSFAFQHDARLKSISKKGATVHFFNNNNDLPTSFHKSSGMEYHLDITKNASNLLKNLHDPLQPSFSYAEGSFQALPNGNTLVAYGSDPVFKEFGPSGDTDVRMTVRFGIELEQMSYRSFRQEWHAVPKTSPDVVVHMGKGYVSWNGATDVTDYGVYGGVSKKSLKLMKKIKKKGFETEFTVPPKAKYLRMAAYEKGKMLRKSKIIHVN